MSFITRIIGVAALTFSSTTAAQSYPNHARIHARSPGQLQPRVASLMTCACPPDVASTSTAPAVSVITVTETETQNVPWGSASTVSVTVLPSGSVSTVTRYISDGTIIPAETITITERENAVTGQPSIITITATQSPPPGNNYHVITVTATQEAQPTTNPYATESDLQEPNQTDGELGAPTDSSAGQQTYNASNSPLNTASPTVPGNYHYCHSQICYNSRSDVVTTLAPMTTEGPGCGTDTVSVVLKTVYNTVTQTVYGLPTGSAGNSTGSGSGSDTNSTATLVPRGARVPGGLFGKLRSQYQ